MTAFRRRRGRIKRSDLFEEYKRYCEENERVIYKKNIFFSNLREKGFEEVKVKGIMYFVGIELKSDFIQVDENEQQTLPFPRCRKGAAGAIGGSKGGKNRNLC